MGARTLAPGGLQQVGEYWLAGRLGEGGQGVVYEAYDKAGVRVAIKVLHGDLTGDDASRGRSIREVVAAQRVSPFCTARILAADLESSPPYIVSEYIAGLSLKQAVEQGGSIEGQELHRLAVGIATALTAIHHAGVVHRDLKPHNVLLGRDGPRVIDFGIARTEEMTQSATERVRGTPAYMAPEVFRGERAERPADVWAWGAVVLFTATGRAPFNGDQLATVMHRVLTHDPDLSVLTEPLRSLVAVALAKEPTERPSAQELLLKLVGGHSEAVSLLSEGSRAAAGRLSSITAEGADLSMAEVAESVYESLNPDAQETVPRILLRMVTPGVGADDTLRRVRTAELLDRNTTEEIVDQVLSSFAMARLVTRDDETVGIANAALLRAWPRLRDWVKAEREGLDIHHALADAARLWDEHNRNPNDLYQGSLLDRALQWAATGRRHLAWNRPEQAFIDASLAHRRLQSRRRQLLSLTLAVLLLIAMVAVGVAVKSVNDANRQRRLAISRQVAIESEALGDADPALAFLLAGAAQRIAATPEARHSVLTAIARPSRAFLPGAGWGPVAFSPDGTTLATSSATGDQDMELWNIPTRRRIATLPTESFGKISALVFSQGGKTLLTATASGSVGENSGDDPDTESIDRVDLWDVATRHRISNLLTVRNRHKSEFTAVAFSPDRKTLAAASRDNVIRLRSIGTGRQFGSALQTNTVDAIAFSPDGRILVTSSRRDHSVRRWNVDTHQEVGTPLTVHNKTIYAMAFSPDGKTLATGLTDGTVRLWNADTHQQLGGSLISLSDEVFGVAFSPDGKTLAAAGTDVRLWSVTTFRQKGAPLAGHTGGIDALAFSPDGKTLATGSDGNGDGQIGGALAPGGSDIFDTTKDDNTVRLWTLDANPHQTGILQMKKTFPLGAYVPGVTQIAFGPDGKTLTIVNTAEDVESWSVATHRKTSTININIGGADWAAFSPDGKTLATVAEDGVKFWSMATNRQTGTIRTGLLEAPAFSPDGKTIAVADGFTVKLWNVATGRQSGAIATDHTASIDQMAFSPDGKTLATTSRDNTARLWNIATGRQQGAPLIGHTKSVNGVAFSPDGAIVATASDDNTARLWDVGTGRQLGAPLMGHTGDVINVAFSPDGETLATTSNDKTARLWNVAFPANPFSVICANAGRSLSHEEWNRYIPGEPFRQICP